MPYARPERPVPARLKARTEFSITLHVPKPSSAVSSNVSRRYRFEYKPAGPQTPWSQAKHVETSAHASEILLDDLNPTSSYEIRIYAIDQIRHTDQTIEEFTSEPSLVAAVDTDVPGCTPEPSCCIL